MSYAIVLCLHSNQPITTPAASPLPRPPQDKARPIRYPARIPAAVEELLRGTDAVLEGLRQQTLSYVTEAVKELRTQVRWCVGGWRGDLEGWRGE